MNKHIVLFEEGKHPRVLHGVNPADYDHTKILVNPVIPRGIPPHRWKKGKGCIEVIPETGLEEATVKELPILPKSSLKLKHKMLLVLLSAAIAFLLSRML